MKEELEGLGFTNFVIKEMAMSKIRWGEKRFIIMYEFKRWTIKTSVNVDKYGVKYIYSSSKPTRQKINMLEQKVWLSNNLEIIIGIVF